MESKLLEQIESLRQEITSCNGKHESDQLQDLFAALAKAQMEMEIAKNDSANPFFKSKYADLASVVKASRPFLSKHGLSVIQRILPYGPSMYLYTRLCHASGQWMESKMAISPSKNDIQATGSYITYLRRYCYAAIVGVVSSDEDDDGENAMQTTRKINFSDVPSTKISREQLDMLSKELEGHTDLVDTILKAFGITKISDIDQKHFLKCIERIRQIKSQKE